MMSVRSNWPMFSALMRKYAWSGTETCTPGGTQTNEPPDHTAELSAENLLSAGGMTDREVLLDDVLVLAQPGVHVGEEHALRFEVLADAMVDDFGIVLRGDAAEELALGFGDAQAVERALDVLGDFFPRLALDVGRAHVIEDVVEVDLLEQFEVRPRRHRLARRRCRARGGANRASTAARSSSSRSARRYRDRCLCAT